MEPRLKASLSGDECCKNCDWVRDNTYSSRVYCINPNMLEDENEYNWVYRSQGCEKFKKRLDELT